MITLTWLLLIGLAAGVLALVDGIWRLRARGGSTVVGIIEVIVAGLFLLSLFLPGIPFGSVVTIVVRKGNPHNVEEWEHLASRPDLKIITANPKTSGAAKLSLLACWGAVIKQGGSEEEAEALVKAVYSRVPALESSSRAATVTFARKLIGDVHLTWENEAQLEVKESRGQLEIRYPKRSILAEPHVAVVSLENLETPDRPAEPVRRQTVELTRAAI